MYCSDVLAVKYSPCFSTSGYSDSSTPFIVTPTSLLPKHAPITDVQQIIGRNGQEWINCTSGSKGGSVHIFSVVDRSFMVGNRMNTAIIGPRTYPKNGLYYCSAGPTSLYYISLFLRNSSKRVAYMYVHLITANKLYKQIVIGISFLHC